MTEPELMFVLDLACGRGKYAYLGPWLHTYPPCDGCHAGCLELERRGLLRRKIDEPGHVLWEATERGAETQQVTP